MKVEAEWPRAVRVCSVFLLACAAGASCGDGEQARAVADLSARLGGGAAPTVESEGTARVTLPAQSDGRVRVEDKASGATIAFRLAGAKRVRGQTVDGYLVFAGAHPSGATLLHRALPSGTEDYVSFQARPAAPNVGYVLTLGPEVAGLRLIEGTLEMVDRGGAPRLRMERPYIVGADGVRTDARVAVEGCAVDTSPAAPWGRDVVSPGAIDCTIRVTWPEARVAYPAVLDPRWTSTSSTMTTARQGHTATLLSTGNVLVAGGTTNGSTATVLASAELYNPATKTWAATASMPAGTARTLHTATQLNVGSEPSTSGKVLIAGGTNGTAMYTCPTYDPATGIWDGVASLNSLGRYSHTATLLADGKVLLTGGVRGSSTLNTAEVFDPSFDSGGWAPTNNKLPSALKFHQAALLTTSNSQLSNKVLIFGGNNGTSTASTVALYDPSTGKFTSLTGLSTPREGHTATVLANGNILVTGGQNGGTTLNTAVLFNPSSGTGTWSSAGTMNAARQGHSATLLSSAIAGGGTVLVAGGNGGSGTLSSAELWDGNTTWTTTTALPSPMQSHSATLLGNGSVLLAGGVNGSTTLNTGVLYDGSFAVTCTSNSQCVTGFCVDGVCCDSACNAGCGACNLPGKVGTCSAAPSGRVCRSASGLCDVAETCDGILLNCPADVLAADQTSCSDGNACNGAEACHAGSCQPGTAPVVDDGNPCTTDACDPSAGVTHAQLANGSTCDDGNRCTSADSCYAGVCQPGTTNSCSSGTFYGALVDLGQFGDRSTVAFGINESGEVVGTGFYLDSDGVTEHPYPFRYSDASGLTQIFTPVAGCPYCANSYGTAINASGLIVGGGPAFTQASGGPAEIVNVPGVGQLSVANAVNDAGAFVGMYSGANGLQAYRYVPGTGLQPLAPPAGSYGTSQAFGIDPDGRVVGYVQAGSGTGTSHAFLFTDATGMQDLNSALPAGSGFTLLRAAERMTATYVVGFGDWNDGTVHGFRRHNDGTLDDLGVIVELPSPENSGSLAMSPRGDVAGSYRAGDGTLHAFVQTLEGVRHDLNEYVDPSSGWTLETVSGINSKFQVVGHARHAGFATRAYKIQLPDLTPCGAPDACHLATTRNPATGLCNYPNVTDGTSCDDGNRCTQADSCWKGTCLPGPTNVCTAASDNKYARLIDLGASTIASFAQRINNSGQVVGSEKPNASPFEGMGELTRAYVWSEAAGKVYLPAPMDFADDINDDGVIAGRAGLTYARFDLAHDAAPVVLGNAADRQSHLNASGVVTGGVYFAGGLLRMCRWSGGTPEPLPAVPRGLEWVLGLGIDDDGTVAGYQYDSLSTIEAVRYTDARGTEALTDLLPAGNQWFLTSAAFVRNGVFIGTGTNPAGLYHGYRLTTTSAGDFQSITDLGMPDSYDPQAPNIVEPTQMSINGEIVGTIIDAGDNTWPENAFVYTDTLGRPVLLDSVIDPQSGWHLQAAYGINGNHEVVGYGVHDGQTRAFKMALPDMSPCPAPTGLCQGQGVRDLLTGQCSYPPAPDGTSCTDGNVCLANGICQAGTCSGTPIDCPAPGPCQASVCDATTGCGTTPLADGAFCDDGNANTQGETCQAGACNPDFTVVPSLIGVAVEGSTTKAIFTYTTGVTAGVTIAYGPNNGLLDAWGTLIASPPQPPPTHFQSGVHAPFVVTIPGSQVTWTVQQRSVTANAATSAHLSVVAAGDGTSDAVLPDGTRINLESSAPADPVAASGRAKPPALGAPFDGVLGGQFAVTPSGAATYTVPISLPPGIAGMAPNLALVYNSQGNDGIAGQGWSLAGLSMISRCPKTRQQDGDARPVMLDDMSDPTDTDGICLDGEKLFQTTDRPASCPSSVSGVFYRPEKETFSCITRQPTGEFQILTKAGETRYYGLQPYDRVTGDNGSGMTTAVWLFDRAVDAWGNYFDVHYNDDLGGDDEGAQSFTKAGVLVSQIQYTGSLAAQTDPFNTVSFDYQDDDRPDIRWTRYASIRIPQKKLLGSITTRAGTYGLVYDGTELQSITYCAGDSCMQPLTFTWPPRPQTNWLSNSAYTLPSTVIAKGKGLRGAKFVDINGDGLSDFVVARTNGVGGSPQLTTVLNTGSGWSSPLAGPGQIFPAYLSDQNDMPTDVRMADVDGDGRLDVIIAAANVTCDQYGCLSCPVNASCSGSPNFYSPAIWLNRFDRDGNGNWEFHKEYGTLPTNDINNSLTGRAGISFTQPPTPVTVADINGDGMADLVRVNENIRGETDVDILLVRPLFQGGGWISQRLKLDTNGIPGNLQLQDMNRDGLPDLACVTYWARPDGSAYARQSVLINRTTADLDAPVVFGTTNTLPSATDGIPIGSLDRPASFADLDGDGFYDLVAYYNAHDLYGNTDPAATFAVVGVGDGSGFGFDSQSARDYLGVLNAFRPPAAVFDKYLYRNANNTLNHPSPPTIEGDPSRLLTDAGIAQLDYAFALVDIDGDGLSDLVVNHQGRFSDTTRTHCSGQIFLNTGRTWAPVNGATGWAPSAGAGAVTGVIPSAATEDFGSAFVDLNGDGLPDLIQVDDNLDYLQALGQDLQIPNGGMETLEPHASMNPYQHRRITGFPNGLAQATTVQYASLATAPHSLYLDDVADDPNTKLLPLALNVVSTVTSEDGSGTGNTGTTAYTYHSLRQDSFGRGPVGFHRVEAYDSASGVRTVTTYAQAYPYTGLPTDVRRFQVVEDTNHVKTDHLLTSTHTGYCDETAPDPTNPYRCEVLPATAAGPGHNVFVFPESITDTTYLHPEANTAPEPPEPLPDLGDPEPDNTTTSNHFQYDAFGNALDTLTTITKKEKGVTETWSKEVTNGYDTTEAQFEGKPTLATIVSTGGTKATIHTTAYEYTPVSSFGGISSRLALTKKRVEPQSDYPTRLDTAYGYDAFGNVVVTMGCASDFDSCVIGNSNASQASEFPQAHPPFRITTVSYDPAVLGTAVSYGIGRFPTQTTNAIGQNEKTEYDPVQGQVTRKTGPNGIQTCYAYDVFGRPTSQTDRCGSAAPVVTTTQYFTTPVGQGGGFMPPNSAVVTISTAPNGVSTWSYANDQGKGTGSLSYAFDGGLIATATTYNAMGQVSLVAKPVELGSVSEQPLFEYTRTEYDDYHRVKDVKNPLGDIDGSGAEQTTEVDSSYDGSSITTTQQVRGGTHVRTETKNAIGKVATVTTATEDGPVSVNFSFDADGNLTITDDPAHNHVTIVYDDRGRKKQTIDPDMGTWNYVTDGFGDLVSQTDAKNQKIDMMYDPLARMLTKTDSTGTAQWIYDTAPGAGKGKLAAVVSAPDPTPNGNCQLPDGSMATGRAVKSYAYDALGQLQQSVECADGVTFSTTYEYDALGRQSVIHYPVVGSNQLAVGYHYTGLGYLHYLTNDSTDQAVLWQAKAMNLLGQVTDEQTGNGVETVSNRNGFTGWLLGSTSTAHVDGDNVIQRWTYAFDEAGNLQSRGRSEAAGGAPSTEIFEYDLLNRLRTATTTTSPGQGDAYTYDAIGNISQKGGQTYNYLTGCSAGSGTAGPHAVCSAGESSYSYDDNGNMVIGAGRMLRYNASNKVVHVDSAPRSSEGNDGGAVDFAYGADGNRVLQVATTSSGTSRTVYVGLGATGKSLYERTVNSDGTTTHVHFIYAGTVHGGSAFAVLTMNTATSGATAFSTQYYSFDHLGSVTAMSDERGRVASADTAGTAATVFGYDAWGARRNPDGTSANPADFPLQTGHREYTGHEQVPNVGLVNMNGRMYDPSLARFLSPDPNVQFAVDLQSYNRYTYVGNNPLRYTDPTGYWLSAVGNWFASTFSDPMFDIELLSGIAVCALTSGAGCVVWGMEMAVFNATVALSEGGSVSATLVGLGVGLATSAAGPLLGKVSPLVSLALGSASAAATTMLTNVVQGKDPFQYNVLESAFLSAAVGAINLGIQKVEALTEAQNARATGQAAGGAAHDASEAASSGGGAARAVVGQSGGDAVQQRLVVAENYDEGQTKQILHGAVAELKSMWVGAAAYDMYRKADGGDWDFKAKAGDNVWNDTYTVHGKTYNAAQFGNLFYGYVGEARFGDLGMFGAMAGGEWYNWGDFVIGESPTIYDPPSDQLLIINGATDAARDFGIPQLSCPACTGGAP